MPFQVYMFEYDERQGGRLQTGLSTVFRNIPDDLLQSRIVERWDRGERITWDGETADSTKSKIVIVKTDADVAPGEHWSQIAPQGTEVTNDWITGPAGHAASLPTQQPTSGERESPLRDHRRVMVVYGRNTGARDAMFTFLRALGLSPIEWEEAIRESGAASPHNLDAVRAAMDIAQAVVVVLTAEDRAGLLPALADSDEAETELRGQPRQNVVLEAGLALGVSRERTILVEIGPIRRPSDFDGLNAVRITNSRESRNALRIRLMGAGCDVADAASDWMRSGTGGDFEAAVVPWEARAGE